MTPARRKRLEAALHKLRSDALRAGPHRIEPNRTDQSTTGVADEDAQALSEMLQAISSSRNRGQAQRLAAIDQALRKLRDAPDEYGLCEGCEEPIAAARLDLLPHATLCAACQAAADPRRGAPRRKITDYQE